MKRTIVFDYDKTLTKKDTFDQFVKYHSSNKNFYIFIIYTLLVILYKFKIISLKFLKSIIYNIIFKKSNLNPEECFSRFSDKIKFKKEVLKIFQERIKNESNQVFIISASPRKIIEKVSERSINIGMEFLYSNNKFIITKHPFKNKKKLELLNYGIKYIDELYTDSFNDKELMKISKKIFLIKKKKITKYDFKK